MLYNIFKNKYSYFIFYLCAVSFFANTVSEEIKAVAPSAEQNSHLEHSRINASQVFFDNLKAWQAYQYPTLSGYRIQVSFYSRHDEAQKNLNFFKEKHPEEHAELDYKQPYLRLRVGNYRHKADAVRDMKEYIKQGYNGAFIVKVAIPLKDIYVPTNLE